MWGAVFWPGGSPSWTGDCAPRRSLQPCCCCCCCPAKRGGEMRGASAPPLSPPLLPRLLCIQIHLPLNQTRHNGSSLANPTGWSRTELRGFWSPVVEPDGQFGCAQTGSVGTLLCAPTCAPLTPRFFAQCGPYESRQGRRGGTLRDGWKPLWNLEIITDAGLYTAEWRRSSLSFRAMKRAQAFAHRCTADRGGETLRERGCGVWRLPNPQVQIHR